MKKQTYDTEKNEHRREGQKNAVGIKKYDTMFRGNQALPGLS
jgi:hypothetical protein